MVQLCGYALRNSHRFRENVCEVSNPLPTGSGIEPKARFIVKEKDGKGRHSGLHGLLVRGLIELHIDPIDKVVQIRLGREDLRGRHR